MNTSTAAPGLILTWRWFSPIPHNYCAATTSSTTTAAPAPAPTAAPVTREYWIAAETVQWEYAPADVNLCYGRNYTDSEAEYVTAGLGNTYLKAQYIGYTDATFSNRTVRGAF